MPDKADISRRAEDPQRISKTKSKTTTITGSVVIFLLITFLVITVASQLVNRYYIPLRTETAYYYENVDSVLFNGVYIRNEKQVVSDEFADYAANGVVAYTNKCGAKVSTNSVIAVAYSSQEDVYIRQRIAELKERIDILSDAKKFAGVTSAAGQNNNSQLDTFEGQLFDTHLRILRSVGEGDYEQAAAYRNEYLGLQSKITVSKGAGFEIFDERIAELRSEAAALEERLSGDSGILREFTAADSGYFVNNADGYEDVLKFDETADITREQIESVIANPSADVGSNIAGKVIYNYKWRMAAVIESDKTRAISSGMTVNLRIGAYPQAVPVEVISAVDQGDGYTLFVFECELLNEEFVQKRVASVRLLLEDYSGIRLPRTAIVYDKENKGKNVGDEGQSGVYVKNGAILSFRKVHILRSEEGFVIVESTDKDGYLRIFDNVVVSGRNLYDGKIVSFGKTAS